MAPLRGALATDAIDLTHGAADLAAFGATGSALRAAERRAGRLARLERRLAATGFAVDALGVLTAGVTAAAVVLAALAADVPGVLVGVLAVGTLAAVEVALALVSAARQWTQLRPGLAPGGRPAGRGRRRLTRPPSTGRTTRPARTTCASSR